MSDDMNDVFDLDTDLGEVADLVQFVNPTNGTHVFGIIFAGMDKIGAEKQGVKIIYQLVDTLEKADEDDLDTPVGSLFQESFTGNDMGKKLLKLRIKQLFGDDISGGMRQYIEAANISFRSDAMVQMTTKIVHSKGKNAAGETQMYENVRILDLQPVEAVTVPEGFEWYEYHSQLENDDS